MEREGRWGQKPNRPFLSSAYDGPQSLGNHDAIRSTLTKDTHELRFAINNVDRKLWGCCDADGS